MPLLYQYQPYNLSSVILISRIWSRTSLATNEGIEELRMAGNAWKLIKNDSTSTIDPRFVNIKIVIVINEMMRRRRIMIRGRMKMRMRMRMMAEKFLFALSLMGCFNTLSLCVIILILLFLCLFLLLLFCLRLEVLLLQAFLVIVGHSSSHPALFICWYCRLVLLVTKIDISTETKHGIPYNLYNPYWTGYYASHRTCSHHKCTIKINGLSSAHVMLTKQKGGTWTFRRGSWQGLGELQLGGSSHLVSIG